MPPPTSDQAEAEQQPRLGLSWRRGADRRRVRRRPPTLMCWPVTPARGRGRRESLSGQRFGRAARGQTGRAPTIPGRRPDLSPAVWPRGVRLASERRLRIAANTGGQKAIPGPGRVTEVEPSTPSSTPELAVPGRQHGHPRGRPLGARMTVIPEHRDRATRTFDQWQRRFGQRPRRSSPARQPARDRVPGGRAGPATGI